MIDQTVRRPVVVSVLYDCPWTFVLLRNFYSDNGFVIAGINLVSTLGTGRVNAMSRLLMSAALSLLVLLPWNQPAAAQQRASFSGRQAMQQRFDRAAPELGSVFPDLRAYDESGKEISLQALRGNYTVLVFGCLT